jgi:mono/diheme cytochrome c family protein
MRTRTVLLLLLAAACSFGPRLPRTATGETVLEVGGKLRGGPHPLGDRDLAALPQRKVRGIDPGTGREATYEGADLATILERVDRERGVDTVIVRTRAREAAPVPLWIVWQFRPVLADRADGVPLPARILAWPNVEQGGLSGDPRAVAWWAHGVDALEFVSWPVYARAVAPPAGAADAVRLGAGEFRLRCVGCHAVRGVGGTAGPDLTDGAERLDPAEFARAVRAHTVWPPSRPDLAPTSEDTQNVRSYLAALAASPPPEPQPEAEQPQQPPPRPPNPLGPVVPPVTP